MTDLEKGLFVNNTSIATVAWWCNAAVAFFVIAQLHAVAHFFQKTFKAYVLKQTSECQLGIHAYVGALSIAENQNLFEKQNKVATAIVMPIKWYVTDINDRSAARLENVSNTYFDNTLVFSIITLGESVVCWFIPRSHTAIKGVLISVK